MKQCNKCGEWKDESEFPKDRSRKDGLRSECKSCRCSYEREYRKTHGEQVARYGKNYRTSHANELKEYRKKYYYENKDSKLEFNREYQKVRRRENKEKLYAYKSPCAKCGDERAYVIDFHHIDPNCKLFNISTAGSRHTDVEISEEVKKCVCLCRNCHQEFHHFYGNTPERPKEALTEYLGRNPYEI